MKLSQKFYSIDRDEQASVYAQLHILEQFDVRVQHRIFYGDQILIAHKIQFY